MKTWQAILFSLGLIVVTSVVDTMTGFRETIGWSLVWFMVLGTTVWVVIDCRRLEISKYKTGAPALFFAIVCIALWIVGFPWYLSVRYKVKNGLAELVEEPKEDAEAQ